MVATADKIIALSKEALRMHVPAETSLPLGEVPGSPEIGVST